VQNSLNKKHSRGLSLCGNSAQQQAALQHNKALSKVNHDLHHASSILSQ
jgi:hypothetical protein